MGQRTISELRDEVLRWADGFDAARSTVGDAVLVMRDVAAIRKAMAAVESLLAARIEAKESVAAVSGTTLAEAGRMIETGARLGQLDAVTTAAKAGKLSPGQTEAISRAAIAAPASEERLVEMAGRSSLRELRDECASTVATADADPDATRARLHAGRSCRTWTDAEGFWNLHLRHAPEVGARVTAALDARRDRLFVEARRGGRRETSEALAADAVVDLLTDGGDDLAKRQASKILVRVDHAALVRGRTEGDEICEVAGVGPVPVAAVRELVATGDAFLVGLLTKGTEVSSVVHLGRRVTAAQRSALEWLYPACAVEGCGRSGRLEIDHRTGWAVTRTTELTDLDRFCSQHHADKTRQGWALVAGRGVRPFVSPEDERHPKRARDPAA